VLPPARLGQTYRERSPRPELAGVLSCVWLLQVPSGGRAYEHRTVPNGCVELACALDTGVVRVAGPKRAPALERVDPGTTMVGVRFRPGAAPTILGLPAAELLEFDIDLDLMWGPSAATLGARIAEPARPQDAAARLERLVAARCAAAPGADPLVTAAVSLLQPWRAGTLGQVTGELFASPRQVRRHFTAAVGYGPKTLQRILRFQGFLALANAGGVGVGMGGVQLSRLAAVTGYADQAHLTRECSRLAGLTPRTFLNEMAHTCAPTHDHTPSYAPIRRALLWPRRTAVNELPLMQRPDNEGLDGGWTRLSKG
jgi:AraC-like DNA-binding protein